MCLARKPREDCITAASRQALSVGSYITKPLLAWTHSERKEDEDVFNEHSQISQDAGGERPTRDRKSCPAGLGGRQAQGQREVSRHRYDHARRHRPFTRDQRRNRVGMRRPASCRRPFSIGHQNDHQLLGTSYHQRARNGSRNQIRQTNQYRLALSNIVRHGRRHISSAVLSTTRPLSVAAPAMYPTRDR